MLAEALFETLEDGVCVSDAAGRIRYLNPAAERLLDVEAAAVRDGSLCALLCAHLSAGGAPDCASGCALLRPDSGVRAETFRGRYGPKEVATWHDFTVRRGETWKSLRVRCLRAGPDGSARLTIIEDAPDGGAPPA